jgi:predicted DNA-binding protein (UPF0251 family)
MSAPSYVTTGTIRQIAEAAIASRRRVGMLASPVARKSSGCEYQSIFRACLDRFRSCSNGAVMGTVNWAFVSGSGGRRCYGRKREEFKADFVIVARRALDVTQYEAFKLYFIEGLGCRACSLRMQVETAVFYRLVYRIERILGKAYAEVKPYALYPLAGYFGAG